MRSYFLRRFLFVIPMFFLMTFIYFEIQNLLPGGPVQEALAQISGLGASSPSAGMNHSPQDILQLKHELEVQYGLDQPTWQRYGVWLKNLLSFQFGDSITTRQPAIDQILERLPISLSFGIPGFLLTYLVCIPLGIFLATREGSRLEIGISSILFILYSIPALIVSICFLVFFCTDRFLPHGAIFPLGGWHSDDYESFNMMEKALDLAKHLFLPVLASLIGQFTVLTMLQKNSMLDVIKADYLRTAKAKGLSKRQILYKHALRNALLPMMVGFGSILGAFLGGSIIIEPIFGLPGLGMLSLQALASRDFNVLMAIVVLQSLAILFGQILNDVIYVFIDRRIDFR